MAAYSTAMALLSAHPDGKGSATPCFVKVTWVLQTTNLVIQPMVTLMYFALVHEWGVERGVPPPAVATAEAGSGGAFLGGMGSGAAQAGSGASPGGLESGVADAGEVRYSFAITVVGHAFNSLLTVADLLISRNRLVLGHFVAPMLFALGYMVFTVLYFALGGTNEDGTSPYIYPALDWRGFGRANVVDECPPSFENCETLSTRVVASLLVLVGVPCMSMVCFCTFLLRRRLRTRLEALEKELQGDAEARAAGGKTLGKTYVV